MESASNSMPMLRALRGDESRTLLLATLTEAVKIWRQTSSLAAYHVIVLALDSNDDEVRQMAEESLNRRSPRPAKRQARTGKPRLATSQWWRSQRDADRERRAITAGHTRMRSKEHERR